MVCLHCQTLRQRRETELCRGVHILSETETGANFHCNLYTFYRIGLGLSVGQCK